MCIRDRDLNAILADLNRRTENAGERGTRCTALLSATLTAGTSRLADLAMVDPVTIEIDPEEPEYVSEDWDKGKGAATKVPGDEGNGKATAKITDDAANGAKTAEELALADAKQMIVRMPEQLRHCLLYTSPSPRDATLSRMPSSA